MGENGKEIKCPISAADIYSQFVKLTSGGVRRLGSIPFVTIGQEIKLLNGPSDVFAFLGHLGVRVLWTDKAAGAVTKGEFYSLIQIKAEKFDLVSNLPSYPEMPGVYYTTRIEPKETGKLKELAGYFSCASDVDGQLLLAMFMTPFWGGDCGKRPAFLIDGLEDDQKGNRGIGKTTVTDALVELCGGSCVDLTTKTDGEEIRRRLLTAHNERIVRMDNIKAQTLSNDTIESLVTAERISGHRMFQGHGSIPNAFTYVLTFNDAVLSKDMSQRCVIIRLKRPTYQADWWDNLVAFIRDNRADIIADIAFLLAKPGENFKAASRFPKWERYVLSKCTDKLADVQKRVTLDQESADDDSHLREDITGVLYEKIAQIQQCYFKGLVYFDPTKDCIAIPRSVVHWWLSGLFHKGATTRYIAKRLQSAMPAQFLSEPKTYLGTRYLVWVGARGDDSGAPKDGVKTPDSCFRIENIRDSLRIETWQLSK